MKRLRKAWNRRRENAEWLRRVADEVGREIEAWPHERFLAPAEEISFTRTVEGVEIFFSIEAYEENAQGDLHVCVDVDAAIRTAPLASPSYVFWKRRNGSVYYA